MGSPVVHFEIAAQNPPELQKFYGQLFDWNIDANNPMDYGMISTGGEGGINGGIGGTMGGPAVVRFYVQVPDLQAALDKAESLGGKTLMGPTEIPNIVTIAMFSDPEGNQVGLIKG
jgi:predicted enzyme related to lactoylglutathione lyase